MRILITGGNGFIGSHFVNAAICAGHEVRVLSRKPHPVFAHGQAFQHLPGGYEALAAHPYWLEGIDTVIHAAWSTVPKTAAADVQGDVQANVIGSLKLFEILSAAPSLRHLIFLSSGGAIYGDTTGRAHITEVHPLEPISAYGIGKLAVEKYCQQFSAANNIPTTIIRPSNPYGAGQSSVGILGVISTFLHHAISGTQAEIYGNGEVTRDFLDVRDLAEFILRCVEKPQAGIYNCGSGEGVSLNNLIVEIERVTDRKLDVKRHPSRLFDPARVVLDISRATHCFDWAPRISLQAGIADLRKGVRENAR